MNTTDRRRLSTVRALTRLPWTISSSLAAVAYLSFIFAADVWSQEQQASPLPVIVGSRIRLLAPTVVTGRIEGVLIHLDEQALLVGGADRPPTSVPRQAIERLEVKTGRRGHKLMGMLIGAGAGALLGIANPCVAMVGCDPRNTGGAALIDGLAGAGWGAGIGALIRTDRWSTVPPESVRVRLGPARGGGVRLSMSVGF